LRLWFRPKDFSTCVAFTRGRVAQLFSNLLGNALTAALIIDNPNALGIQSGKQILDMFRLAISRDQRVQFSECDCGISSG
jgi:hypothetical protein